MSSKGVFLLRNSFWDLLFIPFGLENPGPWTGDSAVSPGTLANAVTGQCAVGTGLSGPEQRVRPKAAHSGTSHGSLPASKLCRYAEGPLQLQVKAPCAAPAHIPFAHRGRSRPRKGMLVPSLGTEWRPGHPELRPWRPTYHRSPQMLGGLDRAGDAQCLSARAGPPGRGMLLSGAKKEKVLLSKAKKVPHRKGPGASES